VREIIVVVTFFGFAVGLFIHDAESLSTGLEARGTQTPLEARPVGGVLPPSPGWTTKAKCLRAIDGDTIEVEVRRVIRVRLLDCWAPESKIDPRVSQADQETEKFAGQASKENLRRLAEGRDVVVQIPSEVDVAKAITMGRWLGRVWLEGDGESLSEKQARGGFAEKVKPERVK